MLMINLHHLKEPRYSFQWELGKGNFVCRRQLIRHLDLVLVRVRQHARKIFFSEPSAGLYLFTWGSLSGFGGLQ